MFIYLLGSLIWFYVASHNEGTFAHLPSKVKRLHEAQRLAELSTADREAEMRVRNEQMAAILAVMREQPEHFGHISEDDLSNQLRTFYSSAVTTMNSTTTVSWQGSCVSALLSFLNAGIFLKNCLQSVVIYLKRLLVPYDIPELCRCAADNSFLWRIVIHLTASLFLLVPLIITRFFSFEKSLLLFTTTEEQCKEWVIKEAVLKIWSSEPNCKLVWMHWFDIERVLPETKFLSSKLPSQPIWPDFFVIKS